MKTRMLFTALSGLLATAAYAVPGMDADTDQDGLISLGEFKAMHDTRVEKRFTNLDVDGDGYISTDELQAAPRRSHQKKGKRGHRGAINPEKVIERLDTDGSGGVSQLELAGKRFSPDSEAFYGADSDGSGELDAVELKAMMKARRAERRAASRRSDDQG